MGSPSAAQARRDRDVGSFDRRARSYDQGWHAEFHRIVVGRSAEVALGRWAPPRLHPIARRRVYDLVPLPLVQAVIAEPARPGAGA